MSENPEPFDISGKIERPVRCECGSLLWTEIITKDQVYLSIDGYPPNSGLICLHFSGACRGCGREAVWHANQVQLEQLIERVIEQRNVCTQTLE